VPRDSALLGLSLSQLARNSLYRLPDVLCDVRRGLLFGTAIPGKGLGRVAQSLNCSTEFVEADIGRRLIRALAKQLDRVIVPAVSEAEIRQRALESSRTFGILLALDSQAQHSFGVLWVIKLMLIQGHDMVRKRILAAHANSDLPTMGLLRQVTLTVIQLTHLVVDPGRRRAVLQVSLPGRQGGVDVRRPDRCAGAPPLVWRRGRGQPVVARGHMVKGETVCGLELNRTVEVADCALDMLA
jgi:hypothetical protein